MTYIEKSAILHEVFEYIGKDSVYPFWVEEYIDEGALCFSDLGLLIKTRVRLDSYAYKLIEVGDYLCDTDNGIITIDSDQFNKNYVSLKRLNGCF